MENNDFFKSDDKEKDFIIDDVSPQVVLEQENSNVENVSEVALDESNHKDVISEETEKAEVEATEQEAIHEEQVPQENILETNELINSLKLSIKNLEEKFDKKIAEDTHKNALFDKMYDELASYKKDLYAKLVGPFINETISLIDDYERLIERIETIDHEKLIKYIKGIPEDLEGVLDNNGVERYSDDTEKFNPKTQRVVKTTPTGDKDLDNVISERVRKGYKWNGVMLKPEMVKIFKYKEGFVDPSSISVTPLSNSEGQHEICDSEVKDEKVNEQI